MLCQCQSSKEVCSRANRQDPKAARNEDRVPHPQAPPWAPNTTSRRTWVVVDLHRLACHGAQRLGEQEARLQLATLAAGGGLQQEGTQAGGGWGAG